MERLFLGSDIPHVLICSGVGGGLRWRPFKIPDTSGYMSLCALDSLLSSAKGKDGC